MAVSLDIGTIISNPILKVFLTGVYDDNSPLFKLQGMWHILKCIWINVKSSWRKQIQYCEMFDSKYPEYIISNHIDGDPMEGAGEGDRGHGNLAYVQITPNYNKVYFPEPTDININMMPFILSDRFKRTKLPRHLKTYWENIISQCVISKNEIGKVGYLTIQEGHVSENESQRRPGIHVETPGNVKIPLKNHCCDISSNHGYYVNNFFYWGMGNIRNYSILTLEGGIYMASTVKDSCRIWNCRIIAEENGDDIIGHLGDVEHLRELMNDHENMKKNHIYWFTDRTPHESLPLAKGTYRQFFRLVTSNVSGWYEDHSTKNPLGVEPDPKTTVTIKGSKFNDDQYICEQCSRLSLEKSSQEICSEPADCNDSDSDNDCTGSSSDGDRSCVGADVE